MTDAERALLQRIECGTTTAADADAVRRIIAERDALRATQVTDSTNGVLRTYTG